MRKNEPTLQQALATIEYYRTLFNHMVDLVNFRLGDEEVIKYLIRLGYDPEGDLVKELYYDREFVKSVLEGMVGDAK